MSELIEYKPFLNTTQGFWKTMHDYSFLGGSPIKHKINNYKEMINGMQEISSKLPKHFSYIADGRQLYTHEFTMDMYGEFCYELTWDIYKVKEQIKKNNLQPVTFSLNEIMKNMDDSALDMNYIVSKTEDTRPIIVAQVSVTNAIIILDGNHRTMASYLKNPYGTIDGYFLSPDDQLQGLVDPVFSTLFKLHHNVNVMANYLLGNIEEMKYDHQNHFKNLYSL